VMADEDPLHDDAGDDRESAAEKLARYMGRPDASMVQAETTRAGAQAGKHLKCPKCHCQNFRVLETRPGEDSKTRRRICRSCGYV
jgi:DNA-directed RNA polymerase subunit M/transcription elongation factor TFIIS